MNKKNRLRQQSLWRPQLQVHHNVPHMWCIPLHPFHMLHRGHPCSTTRLCPGDGLKTTGRLLHPAGLLSVLHVLMNMQATTCRQGRRKGAVTPADKGSNGTKCAPLSPKVCASGIEHSGDWQGSTFLCFVACSYF